MALTPLAAIAVRANATPAIAALLPGGVTVGIAERDTAINYAQLNELGVDDNETLARIYWRLTAARLTVYASSRVTLNRVGIAWKLAFNRRMAPLEFDEGNYSSIDSGPMVPRSEEQSEAGPVIHTGTIDMAIITTGRY